MFGKAFLFLAIFGLLFDTSDVPDISGTWSGESWGQIHLKQTQPGVYSGTFGVESTNGAAAAGEIELHWSEFEGRFNGTWTSQVGGGKISIRKISNEIRGAWTSDATAGRLPGLPRLADLTWSRPSDELRTTGLNITGSNLGRSATLEVPLDPRRSQLDPNLIDTDSTLIHLCKTDGTPIRPILGETNNFRGLFDRHGTPDISRDGRTIAFDGWSTVNDSQFTQCKVVVCNANGLNPRVISDGHMPSLNPDGTQVVYSRQARNTRSEGVRGLSIWVAKTDGTKRRMISENNAWSGTWTGDGKSVVFYGGSDSLGNPVSSNVLRAFDVKSGEISNVFEPADSPFVSLHWHLDCANGDQRKVAFAGILKKNRQMVLATIDLEVGLSSLKIWNEKRLSDKLYFRWDAAGKSVVAIDKTSGDAFKLSSEGAATELTFSGLPMGVSLEDFVYTPNGSLLVGALNDSTDVEAEPSPVPHLE